MSIGADLDEVVYTLLLIGFATYSCLLLCWWVLPYGLHDASGEMLLSYQRTQEMEIGAKYRLLLGAKMDRVILHSIIMWFM